MPTEWEQCGGGRFRAAAKLHRACNKICMGGPLLPLAQLETDAIGDLSVPH